MSLLDYPLCMYLVNWLPLKGCILCYRCLAVETRELVHVYTLENEICKSFKEICKTRN